KLSIQFPNIDQYYFYHNILKPYAIAKATGIPLKKVRKMIAPYKKYPAGTWEGMTIFKGTLGKLKAHDTNDKSILTGYIKSNNILKAYRKYKLSKCTFYNVKLEFFNLKEEE